MSADGFTEDERQAIKDRAKELRSGSKDTEGEVIANIAEMPKADRDIAERLHAVIMKNAPELTPKLW